MINYTDDVARIVTDPRLPRLNNLVLPRWNQATGQFADGSSTIRAAFERLVALYGTLLSDSPVLDMANPNQVPIDDILGHSRNAGSGSDLGTVEISSDSTSTTTPTATAEPNTPTPTESTTATAATPIMIQSTNTPIPDTPTAAATKLSTVTPTGTAAPNHEPLPHQLIIKQVVVNPYDPDDLDSNDTQRFFRDWAGAQLLSESPDNPGRSPRFYGGHRGLGFIILKDLDSEHQSLVEPLLYGDAASSAEAIFLQFAERLGQMHACTLGMVDEFRKLQDALHLNLAASAAHSFDGQFQVDKILEKWAMLGCKPDRDPEEDLRMIAHVVTNPGPFTSYIHYYPCPNNFFVQGDELRIMDFECGQMGHALIDILYIRPSLPDS